ncbi:MAG: hypothetical protein WDA47_05885 [Bacilli bacterium]|jgi:hypothetical protein
MKKLTAKQINKKYKGRYVDIYKLPLWDTNDKGERLYEVRAVYPVIHENTTRGEDVGTSYEYQR